MSINEIFTKRFNEALKCSGKSQIEIAEQSNISKQSITDFKKGRTFPSIATLFFLCKALDVSSDYLIGLTDY